MFSGIKRLLGNITVEQVGDEIRVEGVDTTVMASHIRSMFSTSKIGNHMFTRMDRSSFAFQKFFAADVVHMLEIMSGTRSLKLPVRTLIKIKNLLLEHTWLKDTLVEPYSKLDYSKLSDFIFAPKVFQDEFFKTYDRLTGQYQLNGFLLAGAAGSGKTFSSIALTHMLDVDHVIVICPKNALDRVWEQSLQGLFKKAPSVWFAHKEEPYRGERFIVGHYEAIETVHKAVKKYIGRNFAVILDESHNLNNDKSLRTDRFVNMCIDIDSRDVIWLSGTPIKALAIEAIPLLRCIDPFFTPDVEARFRKIYSGNTNKALDILQCRMGLISFVVEKHELNLAEPVWKEIKVKMPHAERYTLTAVKKAMGEFITERTAYYNQRRKTDQAFFDQCLEAYEKTMDRDPGAKNAYERYHRCLTKVRQSAGDFNMKEEMAYCNRFELGVIMPALPQAWRAEWKNVRSIIKYVHLKIQGECLGRIVGGMRIDCHVEMASYVDFKSVVESTSKKTVVFTSFVDVLERVGEVLPDQNLNGMFVSAKTNKNLGAIIQAFEKEEDINPLVATYASLSTAVPLVMADTMILMDSPFRDYILQQAVSRIHRIGADTQTYVYSVVLDTGGEPNISSRSTDILKWSQEQVAAIMGIRSPFELKDNLEEFSISLEGLDDHVLTSHHVRPSFLGW